MAQETEERCVLRIDLTPKQATAIHGVFMLRMVEKRPPNDPLLCVRILSDISTWTQQAEIADREFAEELGLLMGRIRIFVDENYKGE